MLYLAQVAALLEGKGGGRPGRFQGKAARLSARDQAEALLRAALLPGS